MRSRKFALFVGSGALALAAAVSAGWMVASGDGSSGRATSIAQDSNLNTASQHDFENSATLVDVKDNPVSLPSEKVIYPPSTGNAGLAAPGYEATAAVALVAIALSLVVTARLVTTSRAARR